MQPSASKHIDYSFQEVADFLNLPVTTVINFVYKDTAAARFARKFPQVWPVRISTVIDLICHFNQVELSLNYRGRVTEAMRLLRDGKIRFARDYFRVIT